MESKLQALKVPDLKKLLQDANLPVSGTKAELIKRLMENPGAISSLGGGEEEDYLGEYEVDASAEKEPAKDPAAPATPAASKPVAAKPQHVEPTPPAAAAAAAAAPMSNLKSVDQNEEEKKAALIAELEKRKTRAARWGLPIAEIEAKLERAIKFGIEASQDPSLNKLEGELKGGKKRERKVEKKSADAVEPKIPKVSAGKEQQQPTAAKSVETEEEKAARIARHEADEAAKKRRAERFGLPITEKPAEAAAAAAVSSSAKNIPVIDPAEEERKRKRMEKFSTAPSAEPADKKIKA